MCPVDPCCGSHFYVFFFYFLVPLSDLWNVDTWTMASNNSVARATAEEFSLDNSSNLETGLFFTIFDGTITITGTLRNLLVLTIIFLQIRFSTFSNILIANVAAVDLPTAAVIKPGDIGCHVCERTGLCHVSPTRTTTRLHSILVHYVIIATAVALFVIAVERFITITFPFRYRSLFTRTTAKICVAAT